jgi:hypothetical protein
MAEKLALELPPHRVATELERIVRTGNPNRVANHFGWFIARDEEVEEVIRKALAEDCNGCGPSAAQRVRVAVGEFILNYPNCD